MNNIKWWNIILYVYNGVNIEDIIFFFVIEISFCWIFYFYSMLFIFCKIKYYDFFIYIFFFYRNSIDLFDGCIDKYLGGYLIFIVIWFLLLFLFYIKWDE